MCHRSEDPERTRSKRIRELTHDPTVLRAALTIVAGENGQIAQTPESDAVADGVVRHVLAHREN
jgi:hypothetical protein